MAKGDDIEERLIDFAVRVIRVCDELPDRAATRHIKSQLLRSGTAPAPNYGEARGAESSKDFVYKLRIVLKGLNESRIWLKMIVRAEMMPETRLNPLLDECDQLCELILARLPATIHLAISTMLLIVITGFPLGIYSAVRPHSLIGRLVDMFNATAIAIPSFWLGILLLLFFGVRLRWLPTTGFVPITEDPIQSIRHLILPSIALGASGIATLMRFLKSSITEVAGSDFIRTAHAKGLRERVVVGTHMLRIALLPVITVLAIHFGYLLGGAVVTEAIFGLPGVGRLMIDALQNQQYLIVQSTMLLFVGVFVVLNIMADVAVALLDPRIRL